MTGLVLIPHRRAPGSYFSFEDEIQWMAVQPSTVTRIHQVIWYSEGCRMTGYSVAGVEYTAPVNVHGFMQLLKADWS